MKKKILLLILLLIPFFVKAETADELLKIWLKEEPYNYVGTFYTDTNIIKYNREKITSIEKYSGKSTSIDVLGKYYYYTNNKIITIGNNPDDENIYVTVYNQKLQVIKETNLGSSRINYCNLFDKNRIVVSWQYEDDKGFHRVVKFIDFEGNVKEQDDFLTIYSTNSYKLNDEELFFADINNNNYYIKNYKIVPENSNADGTMMLAKEDKVYKYSLDGKILDTLELPEGVKATIAKKDDKYYVSTGVYIEKDSENSYIDVKLYLISENLEILNTNTIEHKYDNIIQNNSINNSIGRYNHGIINDKGTIYVRVKSTIYTSGHWYSISENIDDSISLANYNNSRYVAFSITNILNKNTKPEIDYMNDYPEIINKLEQDGYITKKYFNDGGFYYSGASFSVEKDGNNYIVNVLSYQKVESPDGDGEKDEHYTKLDIIYYDKSINEIFKKEVYDWSLQYVGKTCNGPIVNNISKIFDNYIVVVANSNEDNYLIIYDKSGNIVRDLSEDLDYNNLSATSLMISNRGFWVELNQINYVCDIKGAGIDQNLGDIIGIQPPSTVMIYYSYPFLINKNIQGEGNIEATYDTAWEGTTVKFTVEPKPGYVLGEVKVTDANGNVVIFTDYTFTMPSADVTIEATFIPINPNTKTFTLYLAIVLGGISLIALYLFSQRKKYLK